MGRAPLSCGILRRIAKREQSFQEVNKAMIARTILILLTACCCATAATAQQPNQDSVPAGDRPKIVTALDFPWETIVAAIIERRYKVEAIRFKALDETGWDWWGSDEVMVATHDALGFTVTNEIGDIDSGNTHDFDSAVSCIISVSPGTVLLGKSSVCDEAGVPGPFSFKVEMYEKDWFGYPPGFCKPLPPGAGRHAGPHCVNDGNGDDFIGSRELFFPVPDLESTLPNVGDSFTETVKLNPCGEEVDVCGAADFADYTFTYRTTRLADVSTDFVSLLRAAMQRGGIAVAGDAVAAALRSLAAPVDRQAEKDAPE